MRTKNQASFNADVEATGNVFHFKAPMGHRAESVILTGPLPADTGIENDAGQQAWSGESEDWVYGDHRPAPIAPISPQDLQAGKCTASKAEDTIPSFLTRTMLAAHRAPPSTRTATSLANLRSKSHVARMLCRGAGANQGLFGLAGVIAGMLILAYDSNLNIRSAEAAHQAQSAQTVLNLGHGESGARHRSKLESHELPDKIEFLIQSKIESRAPDPLGAAELNPSHVTVGAITEQFSRQTVQASDGKPETVAMVHPDPVVATAMDDQNVERTVVPDAPIATTETVARPTVRQAIERRRQILGRPIAHKRQRPAAGEGHRHEKRKVVQKSFVLQHTPKMRLGKVHSRPRTKSAARIAAPALEAQAKSPVAFRTLDEAMQTFYNAR